MASFIKKIIAGISTMAMVASLAVPVAFAEQTEIFSEDYTADADGSSWTVMYASSKSVTADGLVFSNSAGGQRYVGIPLESAITSSAVVEYDVKVSTAASRNLASTIWICQSAPSSSNAANSPSGIIAQLAINANSGACTANGDAFTITPTSYSTGWIHVEQIVNAEIKEVTTTITKDETQLYSGSASYTSSTGTFGAFGVSVSREGNVSFKNLKISSIDSPAVAVEDVSEIEVGTTALVATVSNALSVNVELTDPSNFTYTLDEVSGGYEVSVTANDDAAHGSATDVTITAVNDITVQKTITVSAKTAEDFVQDTYDALALSGSSVELVDGTEYKVTNSITLPTPANENTSISWSLAPASNSFAKLQDNEVIKVTKSEEMDGTVLTLTADIAYGDVSMTKTFTLDLVYQSYDIYYNESFDGFATGTLVNLTSGNQSNTTYGDTNGMTFTCGSRGDGGDAVGVIINNLSGTDNYMTVANSNYVGQGRRPVVSLTRKATATNNIVVKADLRFAAADDDLLLYDASSNTLKLNAPGEAYAGQWLNYTIIGGGSGKAKILVKDADGKVITYYTGDSVLRGVVTISLTDTNASTVAINNLYIADDVETIADEDIVAAAKSALELDDLTNKNGVYTATADFDLPDAPEGTTVTWTVMQKAKTASEWEASSFISASGASATINPTSDIADYDVKMIATITAGEATDTKEFVIDLPNPMDEINGILGNKFNVVNTTDTDADGKTITFDLSGTDMLKRDLALPVSYKSYPNSTVKWTSSDSSHIAIADDGTATVMTSDLSAHDVTLTAVVTYKKGNVTYSSESQTYNITMGFEESDKTSADDTMGKYRVRYDMAYNSNFSGIPSSATTNITLPTEGYFGSSFVWSSSAPTIISNQGKYSKPSSSRTITLTASVISGSASAEKQFSVYAAGSGSSSSGGGGGGGGGSISSTGTTNKGSSTVIATGTSSATGTTATESAADKVARLQEEALATNDLFSDVTQASWAREAINGLASAGIINGKSDTLFAPNDTVTRAEFAKMLMGTLGLSSNAYTTSSFSDVSTDAWYFEYVESAYNLGIITGTGNGTFAPDALITRQDMAVMVARAVDIAGKTISETTEVKVFADAGSIANYAQASVDTLVKGGVINGVSDTEFAPLANATRAQAAKILYQFL